MRSNPIGWLRAVFATSGSGALWGGLALVMAVGLGAPAFAAAPSAAPSAAAPVASPATDSMPADTSPDGAAADVQAWVDLVLNRDTPPTMSDYEKMAGQNAEEDKELLALTCEKNHWVPAHEHPECVRYVQALFDAGEVSWYLAWLRSKLPLSPSVTIVEVAEINADGGSGYQRVTAKLDDTTVVFQRETDPLNIALYGQLTPLTIGGKDVRGMFNAEEGMWWRKMQKK